MLSIVHNIVMMNADRQFGIVSGKKSKSSEKLSSGYKINRAADDAAGLAISEKMRRQIRGLKKGSENIQEGISLIQVADGALDEVVDMLQRINELSVKAYNGTNTENDRKCIQEEITNLVDEIQRIAETTTYNEIPVFQGNDKKIVKIEADMIYYGTKTEEIVKEIPEWLKSGVDEKLEKHNYNGLTQDDTGKMFQTTGYDADTQTVYGVYYGPKDEGTLYNGYTYAGAWTSTMNDNATAKISFSGLTQFDDAGELYYAMTDLLGSAIGVPCGTCNEEFYGIAFSGGVDGNYFYPEYYYTNGEDVKVGVGGNLNITGWKAFTDSNGNAVNCFDKILDLINTQNALLKEGKLTEAEQKAQVQSLASEIAQKLCAETYKCMTSVTEYANHYDRAYTDGVYDIIVYDYRDMNKLSTSQAADTTVLTGAVGTAAISYSSLMPGEKVEIENPLLINCSSQFGDWIFIDLPCLDIESLGIESYDIARYREEIQYTGDAYNQYMDALRLWEEDYHYEYETEAAHKIEKTSLKCVMSQPVFENGECTGFNNKYEIETIVEDVPERQIRVKVHNNTFPKPTLPEGERVRVYDPDHNSMIKDALEYVLLCRTKLGVTQNRLEHAYNNNQNKEENLTASDSRIRDTDIAGEMVNYSNLSIIQQAGQAMLANSKQDREYVLNLLQ